MPRYDELWSDPFRDCRYDSNRIKKIAENIDKQNATRKENRRLAKEEKMNTIVLVKINTGTRKSPSWQYVYMTYGEAKEMFGKHLYEHLVE